MFHIALFNRLLNGRAHHLNVKLSGPVPKVENLAAVAHL
jgi:hypothetical protein